MTPVAALVMALAACGSGDDPGVAASSPSSPSASEAPSPSTEEVDGLVDIGGRSLYVRCTGTGSPTVVMEGGDEDTSDSYAFAVPAISEVTRTCVYDRANLGRSEPAPGPRGLPELVGDLESLLESAEIPAPYVLVGTSGGGYITAGYAVAHPDQIAGLALIEVPAPFRNPPPEIVELTAWDHPTNVEQRDYLQVEKDAWAAREPIGDIPVTIVSAEYSAEEAESAPTASERRGMLANVEEQQGWLVLSPQAEQIVVHTGHAVEEEDPQVVIDVILDVVRAAGSGSPVSEGEEAVADLVGEWLRVTRCDELVQALDRAGLEQFAAENVVGNGFIPDVTSVEQLADPDRPCQGSAPREHSHFFTEDGLFGSRDWTGQQVDDGTYEIVGDGTVVISKEFPDVTFHYEIDGDTITFDPVIPDCADQGCFEAQWAVAVAYPGETWQRVSE